MKPIAIAGFDARLRNREYRYRPFDYTGEYVVDQDGLSEEDLKRFYVMHSHLPTDFDLLVTAAQESGSTSERRRTNDRSGPWYVLRSAAVSAAPTATQVAAKPAPKRSFLGRLLFRRQSTQ